MFAFVERNPPSSLPCFDQKRVVRSRLKVGDVAAGRCGCVECFGVSDREGLGVQGAWCLGGESCLWVVRRREGCDASGCWRSAQGAFVRGTERCLRPV